MSDCDPTFGRIGSIFIITINIIVDFNPASRRSLRRLKRRLNRMEANHDPARTNPKHMAKNASEHSAIQLSSSLLCY